MRRVIGLTLTGLGAFFLALALLLRFYLPGQVIKFPLNEYVVSTLTGTNGRYFSEKQVAELTGVNVKATSTVEGDVSAGTSSTAVWDDFTAIQDTTNNSAIQYNSQRSAFDRHTGLLVNCCGVYVNNNPNIHQSGQGYVWPIGTQKKTYQVFDATLLKPEPFTYQGTTSVRGMTAYKFVEHINNQQFSTQTLPGSLVGFGNQPSVTLPEFITETKTYLVDPQTGSPLSVTESQTLSLEDITGATKLILFKGNLSETPGSITTAVNNANSYHLKIEFVEDIGPLVCVLLGVVVLIIGITLTVSRRDEDEDEYEYESDEPVGYTA
jgi:hypothetical protein